MNPIQAVLRPLSLPLHELEVHLKIPADCCRQGCVLAMPRWTPGSYLLRDHARFLDRLRITDKAGKPVKAQKLDTSRWQVPPCAGPLEVRYRLYANELSVRTNHVDSRHAHLVGAATFLYPEGHSDLPWTLRFEDWPADWAIATPLLGDGEVYHAEDLDTLVDTPIEVGPFTRHVWEQGGATFAFVLSGPHGADAIRIVDGTRRIVDVCIDLFGGLPFDRYVFILGFSPGADGGLEHRFATSLLVDPLALEGPDAWQDLFCLIAHEFFHVWNVKRLRPPELGPFDYGRENPTSLLWFFEGLTNFMHHALVLRAGVAGWPWVSRQMASFWSDFTTRPGRLEQSLEEASYDAWIRAYRPTEASVNQTVNYYGKGTLVGWLMDAHLRLASGGRKGVPELFALLWKRHGDGPITDDQIQTAFRELGGDPQAIWPGFISGTAELEAQPIEEAFGLQFQRLALWETLDAERAMDPECVMRAAAWPGIAWDGTSSRVRAVMPGGPAALAGLSYGMDILAVNGWRTTTQAEALARFGEVGVGKVAPVIAMDRGRVETYEVRLVENPLRVIRIVPQPAPGAAQRRAFETLFGVHHPASEPRRGRRR